MIRSVTTSDAAAICRIYNYYVAESIATFEETPVLPDEMAERIRTVRKRSLPWLVYDEAVSILGYAYADAWKTRAAYRYTVESTVYVDDRCTGEGIGRELCTALIDALKQTEIRVVLAGIALPNPASVALHEELGFRKVGCLERVGYKLSHWIDVGCWELLI